MSTIKMSIFGMQRFQKDIGKDIFEKMEIPEKIDKNVLIDNILVRSADFETLYSDPDFMAEYVGVWSAKWYKTFEKWSDALEIKYDPLTNYDRKEEWSDFGNSNENKISNEKMSGHNVAKTNTNATDDSEIRENVAPNNNDNLKLRTKTENDSSTTDTSLTNALNSMATDSDEATTSENRNIHRGRVTGNIGVTTSQQMLQSELDIARFNLIEQITDLFISDFCILVY